MKVNLITGNRKSGTTVLARLIDNEHIYVASSETHYHNLEKVKSLVKKGEFSQKDVQKYFNYNLHLKQISLDETAYKELILQGVSSLDSIYDYISLHVRSLIAASNFNNREQEIFFIKNVGGEISKNVSNFLKAFPESKIISITRDPRFILKSIIKDRKKNNRQLSFAQKLRYAFEAQRSANQQRALKNNKFIYTVDFEDLRSNHGDEVKNILAFCKLPFTRINEITSINGEKTNTATHSLKAKKGEVRFSSSKLYEDLSLLDFIICSSVKAIFIFINSYLSLKNVYKKINSKP